MRFLANEDFPAPSTAVLREAGHDVKCIQEDRPGISDEEVIGIARSEERVILTFDKDYGEIIFKYGSVDPPAVIFLRYRGPDPSQAARFVIDLLAKGTEVEGRFTVLEEEGIRQRKYGVGRSELIHSSSSIRYSYPSYVPPKRCANSECCS